MEFLQEASDELSTAALWYEERGVGIGCGSGVGIEPADDAVVMPRPSDGGVERDEVVGQWFNIGEGYCYERQQESETYFRLR